MTKLINFAEDDIPHSVYKEAYYASSWHPSQLADSEIEGYMNWMSELEKRFLGYIKEYPSSFNNLQADLENFRLGYLKRKRALLSAQSRVLSPFITGPSNFPTKSNRKKLDTENRRNKELIEYTDKALERLKREYDPSIKRAIRSDSYKVIEELQAKLLLLENKQSLMKKINKIARNKKTSLDEKIKILVNTDFKILYPVIHPKLKSQNKGVELILNGYMGFDGKAGFPSFKLTNNNASIRNTKVRIKDLEREGTKEGTEVTIAYTETISLTIIENKEETRLQVIINNWGTDMEIKTKDLRKKLRENGFVYSKFNGAWQRLLNNNSRVAANNLFDIDLDLS